MGRSMPEHQEFWILQSSSHRCTKMLVCFKKEKKIYEEQYSPCHSSGKSVLGKTLPSARTCPFCDTHPTGSFFCCSPRSLHSSWDSRKRGYSKQSCPACFDWPFPRQDLIFVKILQCSLTESSSDFGSIGKGACCTLLSFAKHEDYWTVLPKVIPAHLTGTKSLWNTRAEWWFLVFCWLTAVYFFWHLDSRTHPQSQCFIPALGL